ncbi:60S ribosomal protein L18 [Encephalitozoon intestinalis ATCC 50506]|uniref:60S ribosomal protein L18 n=1 Tax=Encephalitozoon intestinalis (strain ATCC 50506) TaxID=876142 RepID=E0S6E7_ENCIT|nr:60S ribosomal protein L18 [Encephalitozoon intestinalis ATCC 50506]ADM11282.1 60S ribosomal protein L18 [Encephalitozoon intestinalis ATCC 50506]UTX44950.1 ribosomal protein L18 [Encephalitozoon intestinalis]
MHFTSAMKRVRLPSSAVAVRKEPRSKNIYLRALSDFYTKVADNTSVLAIKKISKRLKMSKSDRRPVKISKIVSEIGESKDKVAVIVAKVLDDDRIMEIPPLKIIALQWSKGVKEKIERYGGSIGTLDQLFEVCPNMDDIHLISSSKFARRSAKFWGPAPGEKGSTTYPRANQKCHNREKRVMMKGRKAPQSKRTSEE